MLPVVIGGSPGCGKTTLCKVLADTEELGVHLETDYFFRFFANRIDPSTVESRLQNEAAVSAYCAAARAYSDRGYSVFVDGVIGPWLLEEIAAGIGSFHYLILHASLPVTLSRITNRSAQPSAHPSLAARMHRQFEEAIDGYSANVIQTNHLGIDELVAIVRKKIRSGDCRSTAP